MPEKINRFDNIDHAANWYPEDASFAERYGISGRFSLIRHEVDNRGGEVGWTEPVALSGGDTAVFIESKSLVPSRRQVQAASGFLIPGSLEHEINTATVLLFGSESDYIGHVSGRKKDNDNEFRLDTFAFSPVMIDSLPASIAETVRHIRSQDVTMAMKISESYRGQGKGEEALLLFLAYIQDQGAKKVTVGTDSTMRINKDTGEVTSFYKRTGATGPEHEQGGWEYDVDATIRDNYSKLMALFND